MVAFLVALVLALLVAVIGYFKRNWYKFWWRRVAGLSLILLLGTAAGLLPIPKAPIDDALANSDVLFVADITYSMNAEDGERDVVEATRLEALRQDIIDISRNLAGARIAIVGLNDRFQPVLPFSTSFRDIEIAAETMITKPSLQSTIDPNLTQGLIDTKDYLIEAGKLDTARAQVVIFMTDGELKGETDSVEKVTEAVVDLSDSIESFSIIGYGDTKPARLPAFFYYDYTTFEEVRPYEDEESIWDKDLQYLENGELLYAETSRDDDFLQSLAEKTNSTYQIAREEPDLARLIQEEVEVDTRFGGKDADLERSIRQNVAHIPLALLLIGWLSAVEIWQIPLIRNAISRKADHEK